ncbi:hypothetical protein [Bacterioplanoides sp. SCSIO 12839]|uniref:hypothetical protein n=1 Tax=Bacterioplanoides sp. SCSIO 12839 TaxID=2829569 RepID=UPI0021025E35|nr:hypothetical protein [Bacterioplanoides sp. SCSIO 12839]UTW47297.1 hypothetical protein KFF03_11960 [Bacterioplanoides sp. SCSIO 12839]
MNKRPSKNDVRDQINQEVEDFLRKGGEVKELARGETGLINGKYNDRSLGFEKPKEERTPVEHVLKDIDQRRQESRKPVKKSTAKRPRKKIIYDDFGEPLRVIWED